MQIDIATIALIAVVVVLFTISVSLENKIMRLDDRLAELERKEGK